MAFKSANLTLCIPRLGSGENLAADDGGYSSAQFVYRAITADNTLAQMITDGFVLNADDNGVQIGDVICFIESDVGASWQMVNGIGGSGALAADVVAFT